MTNDPNEKNQKAMEAAAAELTAAGPHAGVEITEQEFRMGVLKCLHTMTNHQCALALSARQPDKQKQGRFVPMAPADQMYHTAMQHDLNQYMDKLLGWDQYQQSLTPEAAADTAPPAPKLDTSFLQQGLNPDAGESA